MEDMNNEMQASDFVLAGMDPLLCASILGTVRDALDILNGKWKLPILIAMAMGNKRFGDIRRAVDKIAAKVLSKELKDLELNGFLVRKVYDSYPVGTEYILTTYSTTLQPVVLELHKWGAMHRERIKAQIKQSNNMLP